MKKISSQIKSLAFSMYTYDDLLKQKIDFKSMKPSGEKLTMKTVLKRVTEVKSCVDHSFSDEEIVKCRVAFVNLAGELTRNQERKIKKKQKKNKPPLYRGEGAVNIDKYLR